MTRVSVAWSKWRAGLELDAYFRQRAWHWMCSKNYALVADYAIRMLNRHPRDPLALVLGEAAGQHTGQAAFADKCREAQRRLCYIKGVPDIYALMQRKQQCRPSTLEVKELLVLQRAEAKATAAASAADGAGAHAEEEEDEEVCVRESEPLAESQKTVQRSCLRVSPAHARAELLEPVNSTYGRGLYAAEHLPSRALIMREDPLLVQRMTEVHCAYCLSPLTARQSSGDNVLGVPCSHCALESYCSCECRDAAWLQYHKCCCAAHNPEYAAWHSGMVEAVYGGGPASVEDTGCEARAALACLGVAKVCAMATVQQVHPLALPGIRAMRGVATYSPSTALAQVGALAVALATFFRQTHLFMEEVLSLFGVLQSNEFTMSGGVALYGGLSFLNHSCVPNCAVVGAGARGRQLVALRPIRNGEQLFIDYNSNLTTTLNYEQRKALCAQRDFKCFCAKCVQRL